VPARFIRHEHVQEVLRSGCGDYVVTDLAARTCRQRPGAQAPGWWTSECADRED
jgi:hypothetical protein